MSGVIANSPTLTSSPISSNMPEAIMRDRSSLPERWSRSTLNNVGFVNHLAMGLDDQAGVEARLGERQSARKLYAESEILFRKLSKLDPEDLDAGFHAANARVGQARIDLAEGKTEAAREAIQLAADELARLKERSEPTSANWLEQTIRNWKKSSRPAIRPPSVPRTDPVRIGSREDCANENGPRGGVNSPRGPATHPPPTDRQITYRA